jgi:hypothetical protein
MRLYCGPEDWARLWSEDEQTQKFDEVVAETITYEPATKRVTQTGLKSATISPSAKPAPTGSSKSGKSGKGIF